MRSGPAALPSSPSGRTGRVGRSGPRAVTTSGTPKKRGPRARRRRGHELPIAGTRPYFGAAVLLLSFAVLSLFFAFLAFLCFFDALVPVVSDLVSVLAEV